LRTLGNTRARAARHREARGAWTWRGDVLCPDPARCSSRSVLARMIPASARLVCRRLRERPCAYGAVAARSYASVPMRRTPGCWLVGNDRCAFCPATDRVPSVLHNLTAKFGYVRSPVQICINGAAGFLTRLRWEPCVGRLTKVTSVSTNLPETSRIYSYAQQTL